MNAPQPQRTAPMRSKFHSPKPAAEPDEQRLFLEQCRKSAALVSVALSTGQALVGVIVAVDKFVIVLRAPASEHRTLLHKSAIVSVSRKVAVPAAGASA